MRRPPPESTPFPYTTLFRSLIGVEDDGTVRGFEEDYKAWQNPAQRNRDRYELWLRTLLNNVYGQEFAHLIRIAFRSEEHTSELQSRRDLVCRLLLEKKKTTL